MFHSISTVRKISELKGSGHRQLADKSMFLYLVKSTNYEIPQYGTFAILQLLSLSLLGPNFLRGSPLLNAIYVFPSAREIKFHTDTKQQVRLSFKYPSHNFPFMRRLQSITVLKLHYCCQTHRIKYVIVFDGT